MWGISICSLRINRDRCPYYPNSPVRHPNSSLVKYMGIKKLMNRWVMTSLKIKAPFLEAEYKPNTHEDTTINKKKLFQLGYVYGQYCVTEQGDRNAICLQLEKLWKDAGKNPPSQTIPQHLKTLSGPSIIGELAAFLRSSLNESGISETGVDLCLLGFMLFCQPLARDSATADLVIKYSQTSPISIEERQQLRSDCVVSDIGT